MFLLERVRLASGFLVGVNDIILVMEKVDTPNHKELPIKEFVLLIAIFSAILLAFFLSRRIERKVADLKITNLKKVHQEELDFVNEDFENCLLDKEKLVKETVELYDYKTFGFYSPLFEGKEVTVTEYRYMGAKVFKKRLSIDEYTKVNVYYIAEGSINEGFRMPDGYSNSRNDYLDIPIFGGYGHVSYYPRVSSYVEFWKETESIMSETGLKMYYFEHHPNLLALHAYSAFSPLGKAVFMDMHQEVYYETEGKKIEAMLEAKKFLKEIANTIEIKL